MDSALGQLGPYELIALLGRGGMGEVWRARDSRLDRHVAIKISTAQFTDRFQREARAIAALSHANVCTLFDVGADYLVMELVEGPTLGERLRQGAIPFEEAMAIALQIAAAIEAAHEKGIIHRDLKPENIKLTPAGTVKVLDFGLAKDLAAETVAGAGGQLSATLTSPGTLSGTILGTPAYMSPEQARGHAADRRADIWSFGVVLHEMLTGERAFAGPTVSDTIAAVLRAEPDCAAIPASVRSTVARCMRKLPQDRWQAIGDVRLLLAERAEPVAAPVSRRRPLVGMLLAAAASGLAAATAVWYLRPAPPPPPIVSFTIPMPANEVLAETNGGLAFSPDGATIAYTAQSPMERDLFLYRLAQATSVRVEGSTGATAPFFAPDSQWVGFAATGQLLRAPVAGGSPALICSCRGHATWSSDGFIYLDGNQQFQRIPALGGKSQSMAIGPGRWPQALPDGRGLLLSTGSFGDFGDGASLAVASPPSGVPRVLWQGGTAPSYVASGYLVFAHAGKLLAAPMNSRSVRLTGPPVEVVNGVAQYVGGNAAFALSAAGSLAYVDGSENAAGLQYIPEWLQADGRAQPLALAPRWLLEPALSPDGTRVAMAAQEGLGREIWILDLARGSFSRASFSQAGDIPTHPLWLPDGQHVLFQVYGNAEQKLIARRSDGVGSDQVLFSSSEVIGSFALNPDGKEILVNIGRNPSRLEIVPLAGSGRPAAFLKTTFNTVTPAISPDGRWLAYASDETGRFEVYVQPYPGLEGKWKISIAGGREPRWSHDGRRLYYRGDGQMMEADVTLPAAANRGAFSAGLPRALFSLDGLLDANDFSDIFSRSYDVAADGRFFALRAAPSPGAPHHQLHVVLNWAQQLKRP